MDAFETLAVCLQMKLVGYKAGDFQGLIESPLTQAKGMQRDGDDQVR
jgi:hypothetical protein